MKLYEIQGVSIIKSDLIPCPHGFSTRCGGVSTEPHTASMNLTYGRGDSKSTVLMNLSLFATAVGVPAESVVSFPQVHGNTVLTLTEANCGEGYFRPPPTEADGGATTSVGVAIAVKTADCVPILLCGLSEEGKPVAVAALHAGWRGTLSEIARKGVERLLSFGIPKENIRAAIGPSIGKCCYEVDESFYRAFSEKLCPDILCETILPSKTASGKYVADLKEINRRILCDAGVSSEMIDVSHDCTCCMPQRYYSHRGSGGVRGSMLSVIALPYEP